MNDSSSSWIWGTSPHAVNVYFDFIAVFECPRGAEELRLEISADSQYAAYINGRPVASFQYADFPHYKVYDTIDIGPFVQPGGNRLCVQANHQGEASGTYFPGNGALRFEITCGGKTICGSGPQTLCRPSVDYISGEVDRISPQLSFGFAYRADLADGWLFSGRDGFAPAQVVAQALPLYPREIPMLRIGPPVDARITAQGRFRLADAAEPSAARRMQAAFLSSSTFRELSGLPAPGLLPAKDGLCLRAPGGHDGIYVIVDLGAEQAGCLTLDFSLERPARIDVGFGEHLDDLRVRTFVGNRHFGFPLTAPAGRTGFTHRLKRIAGRYLQLFIYAESVTLYYAGILPADYPLRERGKFRSGDHLHNRIYETAKRTLALCMHEHYEDCPWREQALYAMDSRNQMLFGYYAFGEYASPRASLRLLALDQQPDGLLPICAPGKLGITIPSFSLFWVIALYEYALFSGDLEFVRQMLPRAEKLLDAFCARVTRDGKISRFTEPAYWNFYEWQPGLDGDSIFRTQELPRRFEAPLHALLVLTLRRMRELCDMADVSGEPYRVSGALLSASFHDRFWDGRRGLYRTFDNAQEPPHYSEYANALAVCAGLCQNPARDRVLENLRSAPPDLIPATLSCKGFTYEALMQDDQNYAFVLDDIAKIWGGMLFRGATSFWETEKGAWDFELAGSLCHGWSAVPVWIYFAYVLGARPQPDGSCKVEPGPPEPLRAQGTFYFRGREIALNNG